MVQAEGSLVREQVYKIKEESGRSQILELLIYMKLFSSLVRDGGGTLVFIEKMAL